MAGLGHLAIALLAAGALAQVRCKPKAAPAKKGELAALAAPSWLIALEVPGFGAARLAVPLGARQPRPLLIALHGDADQPEWTCGGYRGVVGQRGFILCPRGAPRPDGRFTWQSFEQGVAELRVGLPALKARFPGHVAKGEVVLAALGPSVDYALGLAVQDPKFFARLLLVDGSTRRLTPAAATRFADRGGKRVLVMCSRTGCDDDAAVHAASLRPGGVESRFVKLEKGQGLDAEVVARIAQEWSWLTDGDTRWR
jgi:hypothetical protein